MDLGGDIVKAVLSGRNRSIMIIGGADTGKTTLAECVSGLLSRRMTTGLLDLDMGQSHIGPPTTFGWGALKGGFRGWEKIRVEDLYFTGSLSPPGNLLPSITGAKLLMERALKRCGKVVIDTTGLISGPAGRVYKQYKIDLLSPDLVLGMEKADELGHILDAYRFQRHPLVLRVKAPDGASLKPAARRTEWRAEKFREYFEGANDIEVDLGAAGLRYTGEAEEEGLEGRLMSFRDGVQRDLALGFIVEARFRKKRLTVRSPLKAGSAYTTIIIGRAKVSF